MLRKFSLFFVLFAVLFTSMGTSAFAATTKPTVTSKAYYVVDYASGAILTGGNSDTSLPLASLTKLMTAYIVMEKISQGKLRWSDKVTVSKQAQAINESEIKLVAGEKITVKELMTGMMVQSANDAAYALAEKVSGSERYFAPLMNQTAQNLGLTKTRFYTSSGLVYKSTNGKTYTNTMSARDIAILTRTIIAKHPEILSFSTIKTHTFHPGTSRQMKVTNTNLMLPTLKYAYKGVDGLKTGFTTPAKYCYVGTVKQNDFRLISVLLGSSSLDTRYKETKKLYDYVYKNYTPKLVLQAGRAISTYKSIRVSGHNGAVSIVSLRNLTVPLLKGQEKNYTYHVVIYNNLRAPMKKGTAVGYVEIYYKGKLVAGTPRTSLVTASDVTKNQ